MLKHARTDGQWIRSFLTFQSNMRQRRQTTLHRFPSSPRGKTSFDQRATSADWSGNEPDLRWKINACQRAGNVRFSLSQIPTGKEKELIVDLPSSALFLVPIRWRKMFIRYSRERRRTKEREVDRFTEREKFKIRGFIRMRTEIVDWATIQWWH